MPFIYFRNFVYTRQLICHRNGALRNVHFRFHAPSNINRLVQLHQTQFSNHLICRNFSVNSPLYDLQKDSSKVEQTVKALREEAKEKEKSLTEPSSVTVAAKRSIGKRIRDEIVHYYHGFRLLFIDVGIASRLLWKLLNGTSLSRREHKQLVRTSSDVFRLVPFSVFIIVPFMELLLPVFLKFFPGMLPSTFQTVSDKVRVLWFVSFFNLFQFLQETKRKQQLKLKLEMAKFLQTTLDEMTLQAKGETHSDRAKEFAQFFDDVSTFCINL